MSEIKELKLKGITQEKQDLSIKTGKELVARATGSPIEEILLVGTSMIYFDKNIDAMCEVKAWSKGFDASEYDD